MATATTVLPADKFDTTTLFVRPDPLLTRAPLERLAVLPGFNTRVKDADYAERVEGVAESIVAHGFFDDKPFAVVMLPDDETIYIFDGEHRFDAAKQALLEGAEFPDGLPIAWAKDGATVKDLTIHLAHGNNGERLNMVELASVVRRMQGLDMDKDEIAKALGRTTRHVDNLFVLAGATAAVKKAVASGQIAGAEAVKLLRKDPKTAGAKIAEAVKAAEAKGKAKATPKSMAQTVTERGPKMKNTRFDVSLSEGDTMAAVLKSMATQIRAQVKIGADDKLLETGKLGLVVSVIDTEAEEAAAKAARDKAAAKEAADKAKAEAAEKRQADKEEAAKKRQAEKDLLAKTAGAAVKTKTEKNATKTKTATATKTRQRAKVAPVVQTPASTDSDPQATDVVPEAPGLAAGAVADGNHGL